MVVRPWAPSFFSAFLRTFVPDIPLSVHLSSWLLCLPRASYVGRRRCNSVTVFTYSSWLLPSSYTPRHFDCETSRPNILLSLTFPFFVTRHCLVLLHSRLRTLVGAYSSLRIPCSFIAALSPGIEPLKRLYISAAISYVRHQLLQWVMEAILVLRSPAQKHPCICMWGSCSFMDSTYQRYSPFPCATIQRAVRLNLNPSYHE